eukprot:3657519-Amphidinium_carterae.1
MAATSCFPCVLEHTPGVANCIADTLSCLHAPDLYVLPECMGHVQPVSPLVGRMVSYSRPRSVAHDGK